MSSWAAGVPTADEIVFVEAIGRDRSRRDPAEEAIGGRRLRLVVAFHHHRTGFELIRNPIVPTRPAIRYDT